jgi:hypothetical protein
VLFVAICFPTPGIFAPFYGYPVVFAPSVNLPNRENHFVLNYFDPILSLAAALLRWAFAVRIALCRRFQR